MSSSHTGTQSSLNRGGTDDSGIGVPSQTTAAACRLHARADGASSRSNSVATNFAGIVSYTPEPHVAFCPIFVHPLFPVFEPHIQKWVIFVRRRPCVCDTFRFESAPPREKDRIWHRLPPPRTTTIELPECQERGAKTIESVFFEKASPAEGRRRLHKNTACAHLWGFSRPFC